MDEAIGWIMYTALGLDPAQRMNEIIHFFLADTINILLMLFVMISIMGFVRTYIPQEKVKRWISKKKYGSSNLIAASFGAITPFCSCSSIPIFLSFLEAGVPLGPTFSFLITSPLVNEYLVVIMLGFFGWKITAAYVISGIMIGVISGMILGKMKLEKHLVKDIIAGTKKAEKRYSKVKERIIFGVDEGKAIIKKLWVWIIVGVGVGAIIHNYVPSELIQSMMDAGGIFSVPIAVLLGVPMYGSCAAIVPVAVVLFEKGVSLGTALSFMMAISALSFPEAIILRRAMKLNLIVIFFGIVTFAIIVTGYLFNIILK